MWEIISYWVNIILLGVIACMAIPYRDDELLITMWGKRFVLVFFMIQSQSLIKVLERAG